MAYIHRLRTNYQVIGDHVRVDVGRSQFGRQTTFVIYKNCLGADVSLDGVETGDYS